MNRVRAILPAVVSLVLIAPSHSVLADPVAVPTAADLAQTSQNLLDLTGQYVVQGQDADGPYSGVAWMRANQAGDKVEIHWSVDGGGTPGIEDYVGVGGLDSGGNLEVTYLGTTNYATGAQTFVFQPDGTLESTFDYTMPDGQPAIGKEILIPIGNLSLPTAAGTGS